MNQRVSREDAASLLGQIHQQSANDTRTHNSLYAKCRVRDSNTSERQASSSELMHDIITGLSLKLDFLQTFLIEQIFAKCTFLMSQFMKDYGVLMEAAVREVQNIVSFFKGGLQNILSALLALTSEKNLYAQKALALAKGFVASSSHSFDMMHIQPNFGYLDVISDICFKSGADVNSVLDQLHDMHQRVIDSGASQDDSKSAWNVDVYANHIETKTRNTGGTLLGFIDSIYNQQLLTALSIDVQKAIAETKKGEWGDDEGSVEEGKEEIDEDMKATALKSDIKILKVGYTLREYSARLIQRFVFICWISKRRRREKQVLLVQQFLMAAVLRRRALALLMKQRKIARSKLIINRTIYNYIELCKLKAKAASVIRANMGKLFRNFLFREMSAACRKGAHRLIQREWALRHSDIDLRLLRIETYLRESSRDKDAYSICPRPTAPLAKHESYVSEQTWENFSNYSREELLKCNIHILRLREIDDELDGMDMTISPMVQSLHVLESACRVHDVDSRARKRLASGKTSQDFRKKEGKPLKQGSKLRRATTNDIEGNRSGRRGSVSGGPRQQPPKRPGRRHSKVSTEGTKTQVEVDGFGVVTEPERDREASGQCRALANPTEFNIEGQSLQAQLDSIKTSLEYSYPLEND